MVAVKICGVTEPDAVRAIVEAGAEAVGFVFAASPRRVTAGVAATLAADLPPSTARVAVFRHPTERELLDVLDEFPADLVQVEPTPEVRKRLEGSGVRLLPVLHDGPHVEERLARLVQERAEPGGPVLLEGPGRGGRGMRPDWSRAARLAERVPLVLAGGLTAENVEGAIRTVHPVAVDVSSGVESRPGRKDPGLIRGFVDAARNAADDARTGPGAFRREGSA